MHYKLIGQNGQVIDEGDGTATVTDGAVVVSPQLGQPIRLRPVDIVGVSEPAPYVVSLRLSEGPSLELSMLGLLRTQLLAQIGGARGDDTTSQLLLAGLGTPLTFTGAVNDVEAEIRLYDDALVTLPQSGDPDQVPYSFISDVSTDASGYRITVTAVGDAPVVLSRMAQRTSQMLETLRTRVTAARGRTASFLGALLPGLQSLGQRTVAATLRDGVAGAKRDLDAVDPTVWQALVDAAALPDRTGTVATIAQLGDAYIGFKQWASVEQGPQGGTAWQDPSRAPNFDHGGSSQMAGGLGQAMMAGALMGSGPPLPGSMGSGFGADFGGPMGGMLAIGMLGGMGRMAGMGGMLGPQGGPAHQIKERDAVQRGSATPASTDFAALSTQAQDGGQLPTVLAFCMALTGSGKLVYEVLNVGNHATYVYNCAGVEAMEALNRALMLIGFQVEAIYQDAASAGSKWRTAVEHLPYLRQLRSSLAGRAIHNDSWADQLKQLL